MNRNKLFYGLVALYMVILLSFCSFPFKLLSYETLQGEMISPKEAVVLSKDWLKKRVGYIGNQKFSFQILKREEQNGYYINTIQFKKKQDESLFQMYIKKNQQPILKVLFEEWRKEWKN